MDSNRIAKASVKSNGTPAPQPLLDIDGAATYLNVGPRFIRRLIAQRRINYLKIGKFIRFDQTELDAWIQQQRVDAIPNAAGSARSKSAR